MTFDEAKRLLIDMRAARRRANAIKNRIADLEGDRDSIQSALAGGMPHGNAFYSRVESLAVKIETEREKHMAALQAYFDIEDKLAAAVGLLEPVEQDIIIGCYMDGKPNWKVAEDVGYEVRHLIRRKNKAIQNLSDKI